MTLTTDADTCLSDHQKDKPPNLKNPKTAPALCQPPQRRARRWGAEVSGIPGAIGAELPGLPRKGWGHPWADSTSPGEALDVPDEKPILEPSRCFQ